MNFRTKQACPLLSSAPSNNTYVRPNHFLPNGHHLPVTSHENTEGREVVYDATLIVTPVVRSARRSYGLSPDNVNDLSSLLERMTLENEQGNQTANEEASEPSAEGVELSSLLERMTLGNEPANDENPTADEVEEGKEGPADTPDCENGMGRVRQKVFHHASGTYRSVLRSARLRR